MSLPCAVGFADYLRTVEGQFTLVDDTLSHGLWNMETWNLTGSHPRECFTTPSHTTTYHRLLCSGYCINTRPLRDQNETNKNHTSSSGEELTPLPCCPPGNVPRTLLASGNPSGTHPFLYPPSRVYSTNRDLWTLAAQQN